MFRSTSSEIRAVLDEATRSISQKTKMKVVLTCHLRGEADVEVISEFLRKVCAVWEVDLEELQKKYRGRRHVAMRQVIYMLLRSNYPGMSLSQCGRLFNRDHSVVSVALQDAKDLLNNGDELLLSILNPVKHFFDAE